MSINPKLQIPHQYNALVPNGVERLTKSAAVWLEEHRNDEEALEHYKRGASA
ncbi:hypothetical protein [Cohnella abietis]|uniref:Uncharacterized protein n=1 Tax=Cohnella abietis TaxID=2507935 RepID=A0A3T1CZD6_9BACL|nr:hypothetical protein [Cohnella abietis]BBI31194.1 hypothetical protein KCTCHS21_05930 [Cohnella abietis]